MTLAKASAPFFRSMGEKSMSIKALGLRSRIQQSRYSLTFLSYAFFAIVGMSQEPQELKLREIGGLDFVFIEPGEFRMGFDSEQYSPPGMPDKAYKVDIKSRPSHVVRITAGFWMARQELSLGDYKEFCEDTGYDPGSFLDRIPKGISAYDFPASGVSWDDATAFSRWFSSKYDVRCRLPRECEFELCLTRSIEEVSDFNEYEKRLSRIAVTNLPIQRCRSLAPDRNGLFDLHGNCREWCGDSMHTYSGKPLTDPTHGDGEIFQSSNIRLYRVLKGGKAGDELNQFAPFYRSWGAEGFRFPGWGFRVIVEE